MSLVSYNQFKKVYDKALKSDIDTFMYDNHMFVLGYAKYLLEYMDMELKKKRLKHSDRVFTLVSEDEE